MSSLDDILNRVLNQAVDSAATKVQQTVIGRRPLRDPESGAGVVGYSSPAVFSDLQSAIRTIHDPEIAQGLRNSAAAKDNDEWNLMDHGDEPDPLFQDIHRTTVADDLSVIGTVTDAGTSIAKDIAVAGKAVEGLAGSAGKLDAAVVSLTRSVIQATPGVAGNQVQSSGMIGGMLGRTNAFLESNSIAESIRAMVGRIRNGSDVTAGSGDGVADAGDGFSEGSLADRLSAGFDRALARSMMFFRSMSMSAGSGSGARGGGSGGNGGGGGDDGGDGYGNGDSGGDGSSPLSGRSLRTIISQRIGRAGRRALIGAFRGRVVRGMRMLRGRGGAGGIGGTGGGWLGRIGGMPPGGIIGGGVHHAAGGGMGGGAAAGGAAGAAGAGGIGFGVVAIIGLVAAFAVLIAIVNTAGQAIYKLGMQGYETALRVSQYNGELNIAKAQLNVGRLMRDIQTAQDLGKSGAGMMRAIDKLEEVLRPITTQVLVVSMDLLTEAIEALTATIKNLTSLGNMQIDFARRFIDRMMPGLLPPQAPPNAPGNQPPVQPDFLGLHAEFAARAVPAPPRQPNPPIGRARP